MDTRLLGLDEVESRLGIGRTKLYQLISTGALDYIKIGRRTLVAEAAVADYIAQLVKAGKHAMRLKAEPAQGAELGGDL